MSVRAHSQPIYKIRNNNRIKINCKKLPGDFFSGPSSMPDINSLGKINYKYQSLIPNHHPAENNQNFNFHVSEAQAKSVGK
jgi:hypothetical protein